MNSRLSQADASSLAKTFNLLLPFGTPDVIDKIVFIPNNQKDAGIWTPQALQSQRLNGVTVYPNQIHAAREIIDEVNLRERIPQLVAQPGQGKSGTATKVIHAWLAARDVLQSLTSEPSVAWITMLNDNEVRDQGDIDYLEPSQMSRYVQTFHVGNLTASSAACDTLSNNIIQMTNFREVRGENVKSHRVLLMLDEIHLGLAKNGNLAKLLERIGVNLHSVPKQWENQGVSIVAISATPLPQDIRPEVFKIILLSKDPSYLSLEEMMDHGRLHDNSGKNFYPKRNYENLRVAFTQVADRWLETSNDYDSTTHKFLGKDLWTIRCRSLSDVHKIAKVLWEERNRRCVSDPRTKYGFEHLTMAVFHHKHNSTIPVLPFLEERPIKEFAPMLLKPSPNKGIRVYFIIHAARAGKTIRNPHTIRWDDTSGKQTDTVVQSAGRGPGYHKENEDYDIYVNLAEVQKYLIWYKAIEDDTATVRNQRPDTSGTYTKLSSVCYATKLEFVYRKTISELNTVRCQYGYPDIEQSANRNVRHLAHIGKIADHDHQDWHDRVQRWFEQFVGVPEMYVLRGNEETMKNNAAAYYLPPNWNEQFTNNVERNFPDLTARYRPFIVKLYHENGPGYYQWIPVAFRDRPELRPTAILNKPTQDARPTPSRSPASALTSTLFDAD